MARESSQQSNRQGNANQRSTTSSKEASRSASGAGSRSTSTPSTAGGGASRSSAPGATTTDRERQISTGREGGQISRGAEVTPRGYGFGALAEPFSLMQRMAEDMDRLFEQFGFGGLGLAPRGRLGSWLGRGSAQGAVPASPGVWSPQMEVFRRGNELVVRADLPGLNRDDVQVEVEGDVLTISGERKQEDEESREGYYRSERSYGQFYRAIPLPETVDASSVGATFNEGVLEVTVRLPKEEPRRASRIEVR